MLLIHSMENFSNFYLKILGITKVKNICEIGSEFGGNTEILLDYVEKNDGKLTCIDPNPDEKFRNLAYLGKINFIESMSLSSINSVDDIDAWFIDGDHNWYTVFNELVMIGKKFRENSKELLIFVHDVDWPSGYRDMYYNPESIPKEFLHEHSWDLGTVPDNPNLIEGGFRGNGAFAWAYVLGGEKNGVRSAINDFLIEEKGKIEFMSIPGVFGMGVLFSKEHAFYDEIKKEIEPFCCNPFLEKLEKNRLKNYLEVIRLQDQISKSR